MGDFKPLLQFGGHTALERAIRLFEQGGANDIRVVLGYRSADLVPMLDKMLVRWTLNERFDDGMFSSLVAGVRDLAHPTKAFFALPVDLPLIRFSTVRDLIEGFKKSSADVAYPCFLGRRGHPPLISTKLCREMLRWNGDGGLRAFLQRVERRSIEIEVADRFIRNDMNTPGDYRSLSESFTDYHIPSPAECMVLLVEKCSVSKSVMDHSLKVAEVALTLAELLGERGSPLNDKLLVAAALLHDSAKGVRDHGAAAAGMLRRLEFHPVASLVEEHMTCRVDEDRPVNEFDILRVSDRIIEEDRIVGLEKKFRKKMDLHAGNPRSLRAIQRRFQNSKMLQAKVEKAIGEPLTSALSAKRSLLHGKSADDLFAQAWCNRPSL